MAIQTVTGSQVAVRTAKNSLSQTQTEYNSTTEKTIVCPERWHFHNFHIPCTRLIQISIFKINNF